VKTDVLITTHATQKEKEVTSNAASKESKIPQSPQRTFDR